MITSSKTCHANSRARARGTPSRHSREGGNPCATRVPFPFSRHGSDSTSPLELQSHKPHADRSNETDERGARTMDKAVQCSVYDVYGVCVWG